MSTPVMQDTFIVKDDGIVGGFARIAGTRIKVHHIVIEYDRMGWTPDQICDQHPSLSLAQVHAAIAYYYANKEQIDREIREDQEFIEQVRKSRTQ